MDFGVSYFPTDESIEPAELARMAEERGLRFSFSRQIYAFPITNSRLRGLWYWLILPGWYHITLARHADALLIGIFTKEIKIPT